MISFCFASNPIILYIALIPYVLGGIAGPSVQGIVSNSVTKKEQGNLQGALHQVMSLTAIIGPLLYTALFARFSGAGRRIIFRCTLHGRRNYNIDRICDCVFLS